MRKKERGRERERERERANGPNMLRNASFLDVFTSDERTEESRR